MAKTRNSTKARIDGQYEECVVAYMDILGFAEMVRRSEEDAEAFRRILESMQIVNAIPSGGKKGVGGARRDMPIHSRFFSDSLVFFVKPKPSHIAQLFFVLRYLQDRLWQRHICLRGAIAKGKMYWPANDDNITVGQGLVEAYRIESTVAIYPRIVVSDTLYRYIADSEAPANPFAKDRDTSLTHYIATDADGVRFLDLLHRDIQRAEGERLERYGKNGFTVRWSTDAVSARPRLLASVDAVIRDNLAVTDERCRQKYAWLQTYRNRHDG